MKLKAAIPQGDDPIPSPSLADHSLHAADVVHPPPETQVRMALLSHLSTHTEGRDSVSGCQSRLLCFHPAGTVLTGGVMHTHGTRMSRGAATSLHATLKKQREEATALLAFWHWLFFT